MALYLSSPIFSARYLIGFTIAAFALFRCGVFIHEIAHMPGKRMRLFRAAWNILFGIPTLMPSFAYKCHMDHHNPRHFGTVKDGEYLALGAGPVGRIVLAMMVTPLFIRTKRDFATDSRVCFISVFTGLGCNAPNRERYRRTTP